LAASGPSTTSSPAFRRSALAALRDSKLQMSLRE
jgi:hypothetical protein